MPSITYTNSTPGTIVDCFPVDASLSNWNSLKVRLTEGTGANIGRWTGTLDPGDWAVFEGGTTPSTFELSVGIIDVSGPIIPTDPPTPNTCRVTLLASRAGGVTQCRVLISSLGSTGRSGERAFVNRAIDDTTEDDGYIVFDLPWSSTPGVGKYRVRLLDLDTNEVIHDRICTVPDEESLDYEDLPGGTLPSGVDATGLLIREVDGTPSGTINTLIVPNGSLAVSGGTGTLDVTGGSSLRNLVLQGTDTNGQFGNVQIGGGNAVSNPENSIRLQVFGSSSSTFQIRLGHSNSFYYDLGRDNATTGDFVIRNPGGECLRITNARNLQLPGNLTASGTLRVGGGTVVQNILSATATLDFSSIAANGFQDLTIIITGAVSGDTVIVNPIAGSATTDVVYTGWVSAADTVTIRASNVSATTARDPASGTFRATVIRF